MRTFKLIQDSLVLIIVLFLSKTITGTDGRYIIYCPCMGRFGNQAEQLLGSLQFAKLLNRTLVLPPFISHQNRKVHFISFDDILDVEPIKEYTSVMTLEEFMSKVSPLLWPPEKRKIFCYSRRAGRDDDCNAMEGSPFGPFWRHVGVTRFSDSIFYSPLTTRAVEAKDWINAYDKEPVLAFVGAPSSFPVDDKTTELQKYIRFSQKSKSSAEDYMKLRGLEHPYIAVHWRHGRDWKRACNLLNDSDMKQMFSSKQCFPGNYRLPYKLCYHDVHDVAEDIISAITSASISTVYVATDHEDNEEMKQLYQMLSEKHSDIVLITPTKMWSTESQIGLKKYSSPDFLQDLVIMSEADLFIGNCVSSYTAFVSRLRKWKTKNSATMFFANENVHRIVDEL